MGWMNYCFYLALSYIPLGITMALEFTGPLCVALFASRRPLDFLWVALAALGLVALLPLGLGGRSLSVLGVLYALGAGACWALYILFGRRAGAAHGGQITSLGTVIGALMIVPIGFAHSGTALLAPAILPLAIRRRGAVECVALLAGNVCHAANSDPHFWGLDESQSSARRGGRPDPAR